MNIKKLLINILHIILIKMKKILYYNNNKLIIWIIKIKKWIGLSQFKFKGKLIKKK